MSFVGMVGACVAGSRSGALLLYTLELISCIWRSRLATHLFGAFVVILDSSSSDLDASVGVVTDGTHLLLGS